MEQPIYECCRCESQWSEVKPTATGCPTCMCISVRWINYEDMYLKNKAGEPKNGQESQR
jgi:hypothetical protein